MQRALACLLLAACSASWALGPAAPFEPPRRVAAPETASAAATPAVAATAVRADGLRGLRLGRERTALIDGAWQREGDAVRGARLARIDARGAVLQHADGRRERLWFAAADDGDAAPIRLHLSGSPR